MSIFSDLFHSRDKPTNATSSSSYHFFTDGSANDIAVYGDGKRGGG